MQHGMRGWSVAYIWDSAIQYEFPGEYTDSDLHKILHVSCWIWHAVLSWGFLARLTLPQHSQALNWKPCFCSKLSPRIYGSNEFKDVFISTVKKPSLLDFKGSNNKSAPPPPPVQTHFLVFVYLWLNKSWDQAILLWQIYSIQLSEAQKYIPGGSLGALYTCTNAFFFVCLSWSC